MNVHFDNCRFITLIGYFHKETGCNITLIIYSVFLIQSVCASLQDKCYECNYNIQTPFGPILWLKPKHIRDGAFSDVQTRTTEMEEA